MRRMYFYLSATAATAATAAAAFMQTTRPWLGSFRFLYSIRIESLNRQQSRYYTKCRPIYGDSTSSSSEMETKKNSRTHFVCIWTCENCECVWVLGGRYECSECRINVCVLWLCMCVCVCGKTVNERTNESRTILLPKRKEKKTRSIVYRISYTNVERCTNT